MSAGVPPLLSAGALRADGRRPTELRGLRCSTCCSPLHLLRLSSADSSSNDLRASRNVTDCIRSDAGIRGSSSDDTAADGLHGGSHCSSSSSSKWKSGCDLEQRLESDADKGSRKRMKRTRIAASFPASVTHADGRGVVSLGCTKVAVFVFGPRPLLRGGGGTAGGPWSEGMAAASSFLRAAEEGDAGGSGTSAAAAVGARGDRQGEEEEMSFLSERCFDSLASSAGAGAADSKAALLLCHAGIAPFSSGEVGSSGERRTVAAGAAAGSGAAAAAAAFAAATAAGGGGGAAAGAQGGGGGGTQQEQELALTVRKILQGVILEESHPRAAICVFIHVLQDDGGVLAASVCAAGLALIEAGIAVRDFVAAVSCICPPRPAIPLLDPFRAELHGSAPTLTVALLPSTEEVVLLQLNGKVSAATFEERVGSRLLSSKDTLSRDICAYVDDYVTSGGVLHGHALLFVTPSGIFHDGARAHLVIGQVGVSHSVFVGDSTSSMYGVCVKGCREVAAVMRATIREAAARRLGFAS